MVIMENTMEGNNMKTVNGQMVEVLPPPSKEEQVKRYREMMLSSTAREFKENVNMQGIRYIFKNDIHWLRRLQFLYSLNQFSVILL